MTETSRSKNIDMADLNSKSDSGSVGEGSMDNLEQTGQAEDQPRTLTTFQYPIM